MIPHPAIIHGSGVNDRVNEMRKDGKETEAEKFIKKGENTPYYKYDNIFKDTYTNIIWAVKDRCTIHLLFDVSCNDFLKRALDELIKRMDTNISYEALLRDDKKYFDSLSTSNMQDYINFAISNSKHQFDEIRKELDVKRKEFTQYMARAMECAKVVQRLEDQLNAFDMQTFEQKEKEKALKNYQDTMAINKVKCVFIADGSVHIYTKNIYTKDPRTKKWHDIGTFHITLGMLNKTYDVNNTVRIFNTKYSGMGMGNEFQAPHVYGDGHVCHGNMASSMVDAYKQRNLFELVFQIIVFLQSVNTSDAAGVHINSWPEVLEEVVNRNEEIDNHEIYKEISAEEKKFDNMLAEALPIHMAVT
jgi:hypothetical protein